MTGHVNGPGQAQQTYTASSVPGGAVQPQAVSGKWNGLTVTAGRSEASLISNAADEMRASTDRHIALELAERKQLERHNLRHFNVMIPSNLVLTQAQQRIIERLRKFSSDIKKEYDEDDEDTAATRDSPDSAKNSTFRQAAEEAFIDPTDRHAALLWVEENMREGSPGLAKLAERERERLEAEAGPEIQAGYNIIAVETGEVGGVETGREMYNRVVIGYKDISMMLDELLSRYGENDLGENIAFLRKAVGADLSAATPSTDKMELETMNNDLYQLRVLGNFINEFAADLGAVRERNAMHPLPLAAVNTLKLFCKVKNERLILLDPLKSILGLGGRSSATYDVRALTLACKLAHELPNKLFNSEDARQLLLAAGQKMLDAAIDLEEDLDG